MVKMTAVCEKCGKVVTLIAYQNATVHYDHDPECPTPLINLMTENPRRLGVITGISEPSAKV